MRDNYSMAKKTKVLPRLKGQHKPTFIRAWRKHQGLTLEQLSERVDMTPGNLSEIERGQTAYTQPTLEALADALQTDAASLLMRDPTDPEGIWSVWDQAKQGERRAIVELAKTLLRTGTGG